MDSTASLTKRLLDHGSRQLHLDGPAEVEGLVRDIIQSDPIHLLICGRREKMAPYQAGLATGSPPILAAIEECLGKIPRDRRDLYASPPPIGNLHPQDTRRILDTWKAIFPGEDTLTQSTWLNVMRAALTKQNEQAVTWITQQQAFWGKTPDLWGDAAEALVRPFTAPDLRPALIHALGPMLDRIECHPQGPDLRKRHSPPLWALSCIRRGWLTPTHSRAKPFAELSQSAASAHAALGFYKSLGQWTDWVGPGDKVACERLLELLKRRS